MANMVKGMGGPNGILSNMARMQPPAGQQRGAAPQMGGNPMDMFKSMMSGGGGPAGSGGMQVTFNLINRT